jgi:hypothetical protein
MPYSSCSTKPRAFANKPLSALREVIPFSFAQIKELIIHGRVNEALNLLRGHYDESDEVILLATQMSQLNLDSIRGFHTTETENVEYQKLKSRILKLLDVLASA